MNRKRLKIGRLGSIVLLHIMMVACVSTPEAEEVEDFSDTLDDLEDELTDPLWNLVTDQDYFQIELPSRMFERNDLNEEASLQYGYVQEVDNEVKEHYVIVMLESKDSIAQEEEELHLHLDLDIHSYNDICLENMGGGLDEFTIETEEVEPITVNGMPCMINEMRGSMGDVHIYYQLAVFEGERAFYQVLTWCIEHQTEEFIDDIEKMVSSFTELEGEMAELHEHEIH